MGSARCLTICHSPTLPPPQEVNPVQYSLLAGPAGERVGYVRIIVFADTVPASVAAALSDLSVRRKRTCPCHPLQLTRLARSLLPACMSAHLGGD